MRWTTHTVFNITGLIAAAKYDVLQPTETIADPLFIGGVLLGAVLCDIDNPNSKISRFIRKKLTGKADMPEFMNTEKNRRKMTEHRKYPPHWPLLWTLLGALAWFVVMPHSILSFVLLGVSVGCMGHIVVDAIDGSIMWGAPFSNKRTGLRLRGDLFQHIFCALLLVAAVYMLIT